MKKSTLNKFLSNPGYVVLLIVGLLLLVSIILLIFRRSGATQAPIKEGQIQIIKGEEVITINEDGLVEYRSKDKVYTETWDSSQINLFFSLMEQKARDYLANRVSGGDCGYKVFMFLDGKLVTICIDSGDEDMAETVEPIFVKYSDVDLSDYFGDEGDTGDDSEEEFSGEIPFPTPTTNLLPTPTPTVNSTYNTNTNYEPIKADCETWSEDIVRNRAIISNTYCTVNSTPTPTP